MNIETIIPIAMMLLGILMSYAVGFGIGRRSAYKDIDLNLGQANRADFLTTKPNWQSKSKAILTTQTIK